MVSFKNGKMRIHKGDFIYCPICGVQQKDGKKFKVKCTLEAAKIMVSAGENLAMPFEINLKDGEMYVHTEREGTAYNGPAVCLLFLCEDGHYFTRTLAMDPRGNAFSFDEAEEKEEEPELVEALDDIEDEDEDEDGGKDGQ